MHRRVRHGVRERRAGAGGLLPLTRVLLRGTGDRLACLDDVGGEHHGLARADVLAVVHYARRDEEDVARLKRPRRLALDGELERAFHDVAELLPGMRVLAGLTARDELGTRDHRVASRHAEVLIL